MEVRFLQQNGDADTFGVTLPRMFTAECCIEPTRGPVNDSNPLQVVVGTTFSLAPLFTTVSGRWERSLYIDAEAVVHLENPDTPGFIIAFGTESHLSF